jgi:hypothetical protein
VSEQIEPSFTIPEFCELEHISQATYHKMRKGGYGPRETRIPFTTLVRITPAARAEWHERMDQMERSPTPKAKKFRDSIAARAKKAGKAAVASPKHPSRRKTKAA